MELRYDLQAITNKSGTTINKSCSFNKPVKMVFFENNGLTTIRMSMNGGAAYRTLAAGEQSPVYGSELGDATINSLFTFKPNTTGEVISILAHVESVYKL